MGARSRRGSLGTAFPSSHTAASVATALAFLPLVRGPWRVVAVLQSVLVGIACVYTGNHYAIDVVVGATPEEMSALGFQPVG